MNREDLAYKIWRSSKQLTMQNSIEFADFILDNFDPKQPETVRVTAKEVYLALTANSASGTTRWPELIQIAHQGAKAFNNSLNPE